MSADNRPSAGRDVLLSLLEAAEPKQALVDLLADPEALQAVADLMADDPAEVERVLAVVGSKRGCGPLAKQVERQVESRAPARLLGPADDGRPSIRVDHEEARMVSEAIRHLASRAHVYQRSGGLVRVVEKDGVRVIESITPAAMRLLLSQHIRWFRSGANGETSTTAPRGLPEMLLAAGEWPRVRPLTGLARSPQLRPDGTILDQVGYDDATGLLAHWTGLADLRVPEHPSIDEADAALEVLRDLVREFPFAERCHESAALALLLTVIARPAISGPCPAWLVSGSTPGAGKSLLVEVLALVASGEIPTREAYKSDDDELRKTLTSNLLAGTDLLLFDNVRSGTKVGQPCLDLLLTSTRWGDRILGANERASLTVNMLAAFTGNNIGISGDMARRTIPVRLEPQEERPEQREGLRDLHALVAKNRSKLLSAALTILRGWFCAGQPRLTKPLGTYAAWSMVRDALVWAGSPDPCDGMEELRQVSDENAEILADLLRGWQSAYGAQKVKVIDLIARWNVPSGSDTENPLGSVLAAHCRRGHDLTSQGVGNFLGRFRDAWVESRRLRLIRTKTDRFWALETR